jgi:hypothetical protein
MHQQILLLANQVQRDVKFRILLLWIRRAIAKMSLARSMKSRGRWYVLLLLLAKLRQAKRGIRIH